MVTVADGTPLAGLTCGVCRRQIRVGDSVLVAYRDGQPRVIHAHLCVPPRAALPPPAKT
jgi:hypothetical protein